MSYHFPSNYAKINLMKVLLAVPSHRNLPYLYLPRLITEGKGSYPPLGLLYLASVLKQSGFKSVKVFDGQLYRNPERAFKELMKDFMPDVVGITALTPTLHRAYRFSAIAREVNPNVFVVFGGTHCSLYPQELIGSGFADAIVLGEGEFTFLELVKARDSGRMQNEINGALIRGIRDGKTAPVFINDLDSLPFPDRTLVPRDAYYINVDKPMSATSMLTSRGCPFSCAFCKPLRKHYIQRSAKSVADELEACRDLGFKIVNFVDDTFNVNKRNVLEICREIVHRRIGINFSFMARIDTFDDETAEALREAGCIRIQFGIEAGTDRILNLMEKGFTVEEARKALEIAKRRGITTVAFFILGYPGETEEEMNQTIRFSIDAEPDYVQYLPLSIQPGTRLYSDAIKRGEIEDYFREYTIDPRMEFKELYLIGSLPIDVRMRIIKRAYRKFYFRSSYIKKQIADISSPREFFRRFKTFLMMLSYEIGI